LIGEDIVSDQLLFSVAGARGIVGKTIDPDVVTRLCAAFSRVLPEGPVVVGRDTRPSGESLAHAAIGSLTACGRDVIDVGIATTPTVELATEYSDAAGGVIVTASHNPVAWNALKFLDARGLFLSPALGARVFEAYENETFPWADGRSCGHVTHDAGATQNHLDAIVGLDVIDVEKIRAQNLHVVLDCINGAGSVIAPQLLESLGARVTCVNCTPNGDFYRDPEPRPEHLSELAERVGKENVHVGFAADPDADRLALVDETGRAISEEYTLALAVDAVLSRTPGDVVVNLSTSSVIDAVAARYGATVHRTPVGEAHVVAKMLDCGAVIGGEGNGGVIYPTLHPGRDAPLGMALILQILAVTGRTLSDLVAKYPPFVITKAKVKRRGAFDTERICGYIKRLNPDTIDVRDGVKALFADGWFHLRVSNTEGVVRVIAEATDRGGAKALADRARRVLDELWAGT